MNSSRGINKWGPGVLAVVCVFLSIRLISELSGSPAQASRARLAAPLTVEKSAAQEASGKKRTDAYGVQDPQLHLGLLKDLEKRPLPDVARNPFDFAPLPAPKPGKGNGAGAGQALPPPPPPIPLRALGYAEDEQGHRQAYLADEDDVYVVREGTVISKRFRVLQITPARVVVEDATSRQKAELPIPESE